MQVKEPIMLKNSISHPSIKQFSAGVDQSDHPVKKVYHGNILEVITEIITEETFMFCYNAILKTILKTDKSGITVQLQISWHKNFVKHSKLLIFVKSC